MPPSVRGGGKTYVRAVSTVAKIVLAASFSDALPEQAGSAAKKAKLNSQFFVPHLAAVFILYLLDNLLLSL